MTINTSTRPVEPSFDPAPVNVRLKISALWATVLFVFAYVDLFSLYRSDVRADLEAGELGGFDVGQSFLLGATVYVAIPSLMLFTTLVLRPAINRITNIGVSVVYALTIIGGAIGEWAYYIVGSAIEVTLLAAVCYLAWNWPRFAPDTSGNRAGPPRKVRSDPTMASPELSSHGCTV